MPKFDLDERSSLLALRLKHFMKEKGYNIPKLSKKTGIALGTIQRILSDENSNPTFSTLKTIANVLNISVSSLIDEADNISYAAKVRIISWAQILNYIENFQEKDPEAINVDSYVFTNLQISERAFAVRLFHETLSSIFRKNSTLIFDPEKKPYNRAYVLVKFHDHDTPSLKQLIIDEPNFYLKSVNEELASEKMTFLTKKEKILATLIQTVFDH